ncbi:capricious isoform X1 [Lycorma delicatula]|uniref:capricious isoform X1 n=2 Tax=Lycorma delicatula TaxID=130591 RepID=UPI003F51855D
MCVPPQTMDCQSCRVNSRMLRALVICLVVSTARGNAFCPGGCSCDDEILVVSCIEANLDVIPITLNPAIQRLVLQYNRVKSVDAAFQFYGQLQYVDLSHNNLVTIPTKSFDSQKRLLELHLSHNKISAITNRTFEGLKQLSVLNLRGNYLEDLPDRLFSVLSQLEQLDLGQNRICRIDSEAFAGLISLRVLYLDDNQLKVVPTSSFPPLGSLAELKVGLNSFTTLPDDAFKGLSRLSSLDLTGAGLVNTSENSFRGLSALRNLVLTDNKLTKIPTKQLAILVRLEELAIGQNDFTVLEINAFKGLKKLRRLDVSGAPLLERVENGAFADNLNLESLTLNSNKRLRSLEDGVLTGLPHLRHLALRDNAFVTFPESLVAWPELHKLDLSENPLYCGCTLEWLRELLVRRNTSQVLCSAPPHLRDKALKSLEADELGCTLHDARQQAIVGALCGTAVALTALLGLLLYHYRHQVHNVLKDCRWNKRVMSSKESEYQKTFSDEDYVIRSSKPEPVTEL